MRTVSKIIFNMLASGRGVNLPEIGSLGVREIPARMSGKKSVVPPGREIVYEESENDGCISVVSEIERIGEVSAEDAQGVYRQWKDEVSVGGIVDIDGVGSIAGGVFTPSVEINDLLNPMQSAPVKMKRRVSALDIICGLCALAAIAFAGYLYFSGAFDTGTDNTVGEYERPQKLREESISGTGQYDETRGESTGEGGLVAEDVIEEMLMASQNTPEPQSQPQQSQSSVSAATTTAKPTAATPSGVMVSGRYYVVAGVFDDPANADKAAQAIAAREPSLRAEKYPYAGKTMVTIFSSDNNAEAQNAVRRYSHLSKDLWVYKKK